jgi:hypothetical protein
MSKANTNSARTKLMVFTLIAALDLSASAASTAQASRLPLVSASQASAESPLDPAAILSAARLLYVHSRTGLVKSEVIESELQKRSELQQAGLLLTRDPNAADLRMEVRRSNFTTEYPYVVIDTKTQVVVASGKVNSLFGTAAAKIAKGFARQVKQARISAANPNK